MKNELRLGNFVLENGIETKIEAIDFVFNADLKPIKLDENWLKRFGFYIVNHIHGYRFHTHKKFKIRIYDKHTTLMDYSIKHIEYVHQLQNLVFSLYGFEIE